MYIHRIFIAVPPTLILESWLQILSQSCCEDILKRRIHLHFFCENTIVKIYSISFTLNGYYLF